MPNAPEATTDVPERDAATGFRDQTPDGAPVSKSTITEVTISDCTQPFFGQRLLVVYRSASVPGDYVLVQLASGWR